jgi:NodT family efflux transporter outer membrane factor (OMF) lipoprotein
MKPRQLSPSEVAESEEEGCLMRHLHLPRLTGNVPTFALMALAITSSIVLALSGCASSAGIAPSAETIAPDTVGVDAATMAPTIAADWWHAFGDPALDDLVVKAVAGNPTLKVAQARLARAQSAVSGAQAADLPKVNGVANASRERFSGTGIFPPPLGGNWWTNADVEADFSWELDFFGRNKAAIEAAVGSARAAQADVEAARVLLASNVARTYVQLARLIEQRGVAERSLVQRSEVLGLIRQRVQGGLDTNVELRQGEESLPETRQQMEQLDEQITLARHALAALTVQPPDALASLSPPLTTVHAVPVPASVPAELLGRRADIAAARWRVEAATSDVKVAKAQFYPNINLTAAIGLSSLGLDNLFKGESRQFAVGPAISLPIFDAGRLRANLRGKTADVDAAVESYNSAVIDAVHDVADQLASLRSIARQQTEQASAQEAAESAYALATQRYKAGLGTYIIVLNAESTVLAQRRLAADLKARALDTQVALIRALGGGYAPADGADVPIASAAH